MTVYRPKKSPYYHYDFVFRGERHYGSTMCTTKVEAQTFETEERKRVASGTREKPKISIDDGFGLWWEIVGQHEGNSATVETQLATLSRLLGKATMMHTVDFQMVEQKFVARRRAEKAKNRKTLISNASVNRELELAGRVWKYLEKTYQAPYQDWRKHRLPEPKERVRELTADEEARLFANLPEDLAAVAEFAMLSGQRRTAVIELLWSRVDLVGARATVRTKGTGKRTHVDHTFPLTRRMLEIIRDRPKVGPRVFTYVCERPSPPRGDRPRRLRGQRYPFSQQGWTRKWRKALEDAGIEDFRFHDLRHTAASRVTRATGNLKITMKMLNHSDIATTARYAHVVEDDIRAAMEAVDRGAPGARKTDTVHIRNKERLQDMKRS